MLCQETVLKASVTKYYKLKSNSCLKLNCLQLWFCGGFLGTWYLMFSLDGQEPEEAPHGGFWDRLLALALPFVEVVSAVPDPQSGPPEPVPSFLFLIFSLCGIF